MLEEYRKHVADRAALGIMPKPINAGQMSALIELLKMPLIGEEKFLLDLLINRVPSGVDEAAYIKVNFFVSIIEGSISSPFISKEEAVKFLGTMKGGFNILPLIRVLDHPKLAYAAAAALKNIILVFDNFYEVLKKVKYGNSYAKDVLRSWANAEWFFSRSPLAEKITVTVFKVTGETNTDDLSPATDAWSRPDIPLHALSMLKISRDGIIPDNPGMIGPVKQIQKLRQYGFPLSYVGDIIGTGSSRKSASNSILWFIGKDIPYVPNKRVGGVILGNKIAPIFFNTVRDSGALPIELDVSNLKMGDIIDIYPFIGEVRSHNTNILLSTFKLKNEALVDEVRAGGRIYLIIGRELTERACESLALNKYYSFQNINSVISKNGFTLAQKIVGRACGISGVHPGQYCEPKVTSVGSQDTTGPMTIDELKDLACLNFSADLVMQSFCHTAAYPNSIDKKVYNILPKFIINRGGISLRPGDGIIHSWLNRMLLPDTVGTGADSHTRFPIGISFPAGSGLVAFAAATGVMPLDMPESVLVRFKGVIQPGITLRDIVHSIPYFAIQQGLLTLDKQCKKNIFSGRILEIEGLSNLKVEQAFELADSSAERCASGCTIKLDKEPVIEYLTSNVTLLKWMILEGYKDKHTLNRRIGMMENWLSKPSLLSADHNSEYVAEIEIDLTKITEPILCVPNDPDDVRFLSEVSGCVIDEVFIGSCMTNIGHFRALGALLNDYHGKLPVRLWIAPPTKMDVDQLIKEGYYDIFHKSGAHVEIPGCSLCMGNQMRVEDGATVVSTSTRNFPNRLGSGANVYLASAELAGIASLFGRLPTIEEYLQFMIVVNRIAPKIYSFLNFSHINQYADKVN